MDGTTQGLIITAIAALAGNIVKSFFDERKRRADREWDLEDRRLSAERTAQHREIMGLKLDANTAVTLAAAEKADAAYLEANSVNQKIATLGEKIIKK